MSKEETTELKVHLPYHLFHNRPLCRPLQGAPVSINSLPPARYYSASEVAEALNIPLHAVVSMVNRGMIDADYRLPRKETGEKGSGNKASRRVPTCFVSPAELERWKGRGDEIQEHLRNTFREKARTAEIAVDRKVAGQRRKRIEDLAAARELGVELREYRALVGLEG